jgi:hypothetical protein
MGFHEQTKQFRDAVPRENWAKVKLAIRETVAHAGGGEAVAARFKERQDNFNGGRISEWCNPDMVTSMPTLWQIAQIEAFAGVDWITQAMCDLHGADLVKRGRADNDSDVLARIGLAAKESGEALAIAAALLANPQCARLAKQALGECDDAIRAKKTLRAALEALIGEAA